MQISKQQRYAFAVLAMALVVMVVFAASLPARAEHVAPPAVPQNVLLVPTPITTPSKLDALDTTSNVTVGGNLTVVGDISAASVISTSTFLSVQAPTAVASATPAMRVNSLGANNDLLVVEKNSTPVFKIGNAGALTISGNVTLSGTLNGNKCYKGQQTVLGAATAIPATLTAAGISTPSWVSEGFAAAPGDTYWQTYHTNSAGVVTFGVYQRMLSGTVTPQAATTAVALDYEVCGQ